MFHLSFLFSLLYIVLLWVSGFIKTINFVKLNFPIPSCVMFPSRPYSSHINIIKKYKNFHQNFPTKKGIPTPLNNIYTLHMVSPGYSRHPVLCILDTLYRGTHCTRIFGDTLFLVILDTLYQDIGGHTLPGYSRTPCGCTRIF